MKMLDYVEKLVNKKFEFWKEEFVKKLKEEYRLHGFKTKEFFEVIDKIMGNFNHSPQDISESPSTEDTHVKKDKGCGKQFFRPHKTHLYKNVKRTCGIQGELCPKCEDKQ